MIGVDICKVSRLGKDCQKLATRICSKAEQEYLQTKSTVAKADGVSPYLYSLAGMWAAKEAVLKAYGVGITKNLNEVQILHNSSGAPYIQLVGKTKTDLQKITTKTPYISISHDGDMAISVCMLV